MAEVPGTLEGWYVLHDFRHLDRARWTVLTPTMRREIVSEAEKYVLDAVSTTADQGASAAYRVVGHKSDLLIVHLRPTVDQLSELETAFDRTRFADFTSRPYSYLSVTELSLYEASARGGTDDPESLMQNPLVRKRLFPTIPDKRYVCFYPMNKKRGEHVNWFALPMEERRRMMREHGATGRKYHDRIQQMITGSMGLDDWDWGVTLFADDPLAIKQLVYEMRFDEVSALYAEFGLFQVGIRIQPGELADWLRVGE